MRTLKSIAVTASDGNTVKRAIFRTWVDKLGNTRYSVDESTGSHVGINTTEVDKETGNKMYQEYKEFGTVMFTVEKIR